MAALGPDFVAAAIQEVLARVDQDDGRDQLPGGADACSPPKAGGRAGSCSPTPPHAHARGVGGALRRTPGATASTAPPPPPLEAAAAGGSPAGGVHLSLLEVPGNAEASVRLLKARVRALEEQLAAAGDACADKDKALTEAQREIKGLQQEVAAAAKAHKALQAQAARHKRAAEAAREALRAHEAAAKERERDDAKAAAGKKAAEQEARGREVRLARALEEVERFKALLQEAKAQERDGRDSAKSERAKLAADCARLERQKNTLLAAFRKQLRLIDVLRRQKAHLEAARCLAFTEEEFMRTLEAGQG